MEQDFLKNGKVVKKGARERFSGRTPGGAECDFLKRRALAICMEARTLHVQGHTAKAIPLYAKSIRVKPTAEAHAYLGWAYSAHRRLDLAIHECLEAIRLDPQFGNSYNDIGSYLVSQGQLEESIPWFEKAKRATRYESRHFPYQNLGKVFAAQGLKFRAIREFKSALAIEPADSASLAALRALRISFSGS